MSASVRHNLSPAPQLVGLSRSERIDAMISWFHANFEDPVENTPYETAEGGYQYIWGGPYDASEEITDAFPDADENEIAEAVAEVESNGIDWAIAQARIIDEPDEPINLAPVIKTTRFKDGISLQALSKQPDSVKRETMILWFMERCERAVVGGLAYGYGVYGKGAYFEGYHAKQLLEGMFGESVSPDAIESVSSVFEGFWVPKAPRAEVTDTSTDEEIRADLSAVLLDFANALEAITASSAGHGNRHNGGPPLDDDGLSNDFSVIQENSSLALKATQDMRLAVASGAEPSLLDSMWSSIAPVAARFGKWVFEQTRLFVEEARPAAAEAFGKTLPDLLIATAGYCAGMHISMLVTLLLAKRR